MEAIEAVLDLAKERDELADEIDTYETWFEALVGCDVTVAITRKKKTRFVDCVVSEFTQGEGWELSGEDEEVYMVTFQDFVDGKFWVRKN